MRHVFVTIAMAFVMGVALISCQKEETILPNNESEMTSTTTSNQEYPLDLYEPLTDSLSEEINTSKAGNNTWIMNTTSATQIPSQMFSIDPKYKISYQHKKMGYINGFGKCSWTSYTIAASCIIRGNWSWYAYPVNDSKVNQVLSSCVQHGGSYAWGAYIGTLQWYCNANDYSKLSCYQKSTSNSSSGRFEAIKYMLDHLYVKHSPFLVISTSGTTGHYLIVHAINWKKGGTGSTVYYTDCLNIASNTSYNSNIKTMDFTTFLNKMVGAPTNYNMLFLWPKGY